MPRFLRKLEHCSGEKAEVLKNHLKQSKLKIKGFVVEPNSREAVIVVVSSWVIGLPITLMIFSSLSTLMR